MTQPQSKKELRAIAAIKNITGKNIISRRQSALESAGFKVVESKTEINFGRSGKVQDNGDGTVSVQVRCATGGKSRINGYHVNHCPVLVIK